MNSREHALILDELAQNKIINKTASVVRHHKGSTETTLLEIRDGNTGLAVKIETSRTLAHALSFYENYKNIELLPAIKYISKDADFFAYIFIEGNKCNRPLSQEELEFMIEKVLNKYKLSPYSDWGELTAPTSTLSDFLSNDAERNKENIDKALERPGEFEIVKEAINRLSLRLPNKAYLVHGDLGTHNIILNADKIVLIIDPLAVNSLPVLELLFLIASKPPIIQLDVVVKLCRKLEDALKLTDKELCELYKIAIYIRIGRSILYHPQDLLGYIEIYKSL